MEIDFNIKSKDQLIGKDWKCPFCHHNISITMMGIDHRGHKHWQYFSLEDLFDLQLAHQELALKEREILFRE